MDTNLAKPTHKQKQINLFLMCGFRLVSFSSYLSSYLSFYYFSFPNFFYFQFFTAFAECWKNWEEVERSLEHEWKIGTGKGWMKI